MFPVVVIKLLSVFAQSFLPLGALFLSTLSHLCCGQKRNHDFSSACYPVTMTPQIWAPPQLCNRSDTDELYKMLLFLCSLESRKEQYEREMKPRSGAFACFSISFGAHWQRTNAGQCRMQLSDRPNCCSVAGAEGL